jgi:hypothetical protein
LLLGFGIGGAGARAAGGVRGEQERRGAALVAVLRIGAEIEQSAHRCGAAGAYGAVQGRDAEFVGGVGIGAGLDERAKRGGLRGGIPRRRTGLPTEAA